MPFLINVERKTVCGSTPRKTDFSISLNRVMHVPPKCGKTYLPLLFSVMMNKTERYLPEKIMLPSFAENRKGAISCR